MAGVRECMSTPANQPSLSTDAAGAPLAANGAAAQSPQVALPLPDAPASLRVGPLAESTPLSVDQVRNTLWQLGWSQGSVLPNELRAEIKRIPFAPDPVEDEIPIVVTQGCDAIHGDCVVEPGLEIVFARPISQVRSEFKVLKNPRLLHVDLVGPDGARQPVEVNAWSRGFIARRRLVEHAPSTYWRVPPDSLDLIAQLFGRRYDRVALPEAFVERFRPVAAKLERHIKRVADAITGVFLRITPEEDLPLDEDPAQRPYDVRILLMASYALAADEERQRTIEYPIKSDLLQSMAKTPGLRGVEVRVASPWRLTLGEFRDFVEWDHEPLRLGLASKSAIGKDAAERHGTSDIAGGHGVESPTQVGLAGKKTTDHGAHHSEKRTPSPLD